jgi:phage-related protein
MGSSSMPDRKSLGVLTRVVGRRWRDYETEAGARPVKEFLAGLNDEDAAEVLAAMAEVKRDGLRAARHLRGDIWEVRANGQFETFRVLFASEGMKGRILLALEGFSKKDQKTPPHLIRLAERRLADWRARGRGRFRLAR